jgi:ketosteroid isomerase-like protein
MNYRSSALAVAIGILITMQPTTQARSVADDEKAVEALDIEYQAAVKQNDVATMDRILAEDFVLVTGLGKTYTKADLLEEARSKRTVYERQEDSARKVRVWGDTAVVTALLWAKGTQDGKAFDYKLWFSDTYVRTPAGWRYVFAQASTRLPATQ